jgi:thiol-disulfide isomerase/thioredoxin
MKNNSLIIGGIVVLALAVGAFVYFGESGKTPLGPGALDTFATCLKDRGAIFYGAFWCPHCQATKAMFGTSAKLLPYVECSNPDGKTQTQVCIDKGIKSYPTWVFPDGSELTGERTLQELSDKTTCALPEATS